MRRYLSLAERLESPPYRQGWILEAALLYGETVRALAQALRERPLQSRGLQAFAAYLARYIQAPPFRTLVAQAQEVKAALDEVRYLVLVQDGQFKVQRYQGEPPYSPEIAQVFARFSQGPAEGPTIEVPERSTMGHIEIKILEFVAQLYPEPFAALARFCAERTPFLDEKIRAFEREIQFYLAYRDFIADFRRSGLPFCYPEVSPTSKEEVVRDGFDLALAQAQRYREGKIVRNDVTLSGSERVLVVTGPNQGGKTTFARMVGQLHYLASLGLPVPARAARLYLPDRIFTHFEQREDITNLRGKLEDDLVRIHAMLDQATSASLFILNEIFASTTVQDALFLSQKVMERLEALDALAVWVTFLDELATHSPKTVSMVAQTHPEDPTRRTFKVVRQPPTGLAHALSLARKHGLTYEQIRERLP